MRLTRVRIHGFKTFAERCEFSVDGGLVAVVGPNGCGKSNLVDAILWGLGEGSARTLRAATGVDVIFNGSAKRRPLGFAEVTLTFDNEDHALPIDVAEVAITRRLERSGDSTYQINRRNCRLKDIHDLLADSGLGRSGYSIVGQKEIDAALSAGAEERRAWIDEAAGVQRYRARKLEASRRLSSAREHLARVEVLVADLEAQRVPLERAAIRARRYQQLSGALREVEIGILSRALADARQQIQLAEAGAAVAREAMERQALREAELNGQEEALGQRATEADVESDQVRTAQQLAQQTIDRAVANEQLVAQKLLALDETRRNLEASGEDLRQRLADANRESDTSLGEEAEERRRLDELMAERSQDQELLRPLRDEIQALDRDIAQVRQRETVRVKARLEAEVRAAKLAEAEAETPARMEAVELARQAEAGNAQSLVELAATVAGEATWAEAAGAALVASERMEKEAQLAIRTALSDLSSAEGRVRGMEASLESFDSLGFGARSVMTAVQRGNLPDRYRPVTSALDAPAELATAIEVALGGAASDLIVQDPGDAQAAIQWLRQNNSGRATFQPRTLMRPVHVSNEVRSVLTSRGVIGRASECVKCAAEDRLVIESLLGRVVIVETLDDALRLAKTSGWSRMVALTGDVVHSSGAVTGGQAGKAATGVVRQRAELEALRGQIAVMQEAVAARRGAAEEAVSQLQAARAAAEAARAGLREAREALKVAEAEKVRLGKASREAADRLAAHERGLAALAVPVAMPAEESVDLAQLERDREERLARQAILLAAQAQSASVVEEARLRVQQAKARRGAAERRLAQAWEAEEDRKRRLAGLAPQLDGFLRERAAAEVMGRKAEAERREAEAAWEQLRVTKQEIGAQRAAVAEELQQLRGALGSLNEAMRQHEIDRTRAEAKRATAFERLFEEYGLGEEAAVEMAVGLTLAPDAQVVVSRLRREIRELGEVSLGSIDAFDELNGRLQEMVGQRDDVLDGIAQVEASITELDRLTRGRFLATFADVRQAFGEMFTRMFDGGEATLELSSDDKLLESGVEVAVTLPGKKRQSLALLSGGERALCASAFLFALLKTRPSPLVVLDEVDAPLDGRNVERFASVLQELAQEIQFLVITHNPRTIELAPIWLGVTMQEPGVSSLLPTRVPPTA